MYRFIYPIKDTYVYELNTNDEKNFGGDDNLILKKDIDGNIVNGVSRIFLKFDLTELSQSLVSNEITTSLDGNGVPPRYYLRLYEQKTSELASSYQINAYALSSSWEDGTGLSTEDPNKRDGTSWKRRDENFDNKIWNIGGLATSEIPMTSASKPISSGVNPHLDSGTTNRKNGGGVWYDEGSIATSDWTISSIAAVSSQSFSYQSPDIEINVTDIINKWLDGTRNNEGFILKWSGSQEDSADKSGDINFFSSDANSIYSPKIEVRWDEHTNDYDGTIADYNEEFGGSGGSFIYPDSPIDPIKLDGTDDNYMFMLGLRKTYKETENPFFRVAARERYQPKTVSTTKSTPENKLISEGSGSYSIIDVESGTTLIPFGDYSLLSQDSLSNYFKLKLDGFITNRVYRILLRLRLNDGRYRIFDKSYDFKVTN